MHITEPSLDSLINNIMVISTINKMTKGKTWCFQGCPNYGEVLEAESKTRVKLVFHNHHSKDNYGDDLVLPEVKELNNIKTDRCYWLVDIAGSSEVVTLNPGYYQPS